jgi:spore coat polysaccharide biosynthesis protein SpsF
VLTPLGGRPVIEHVVTAASAATTVDEVIVAMPDSAADDRLADVLRAIGVRVFRGSEDDVLGRFVGAVAGDPADAVVRLTGDNPLLDPAVIDAVVAGWLKGDCDYSSNMVERSWPRGLDAEVLSRAALERSDAEGLLPEHREHVTTYVRMHPDLFRLRHVRALPQETWPDLRLSLDTEVDREMLERVFDALYVPGRILRIGPVVDWLREHLEVAQMNAGVEQKPVLGRNF